MKTFQKKYFLLFMIAVILAAGIGFYSYYRYQQAQIQTNWINHANIILKDINEFRTLFHNAQAALSTYSISGNADDLDFFHRDRNSALSTTDQIIRLTDDNPLQHKLIKEIRDRYDRFSTGAEQEAIAKLHDKPQSTSPVRTGNQEILRELTKKIDLFIQNETLFQQAHLNKLGAINKNFYLAIILGTFSSLIVLMIMNYYLFLVRNDKIVIEQRFQELKDKQAQSLQATKDGIFEWNLSDQTLYWSPRVKEMIGYKDDELETSVESLEKLMHPEDRENFWQQLHQHLRGEVPEHSTFFRWRHKDDYWIWINSRGRAVFNEFGEATKLIGVYTDVTRLKEYELQLARSRDEAEKANSAKSDFLAHMSHEIRTPLTAITGVAEILSQQKEKFDEKTHKLLSALNSSAISLRDLINDILDFSKIESGKVVLESKEIDLTEFFENIISLIGVKANEKGLSFECNYSHVKDLRILGDKTRMRQILINLIGNAVKFTNKGSITVKATSLMSNKKELLEISVSDTGIGISEEQLPNIFDSFKQADASISRKYGGTGLGLPIAKHLSQLMDGNIYVSSKQGEGSTFTVYMPIMKAPNVAKDANLEKSATMLPAHFSLNDEDLILIVEDYEGNIAFITHIMDELGVRYNLAKTGLEGLKLWSDNPYRLILMDIQMPEMDGISAVKHIRTIERERERKPTPIIAMTAHAFSEDRKKCLEAGFDDYLAKPLSKQILVEKMSELLNAKA